MSNLIPDAIEVTSCETCPFFARTLFSTLAGGDGDCRFPPRALPIEKGLAHGAPRWCPLRLHEVTIRLSPAPH